MSSATVVLLLGAEIGRPDNPGADRLVVPSLEADQLGSPMRVAATFSAFMRVSALGAWPSRSVTKISAGERR
jgi:hypothetical protein